MKKFFTHPKFQKTLADFLFPILVFGLFLPILGCEDANDPIQARAKAAVGDKTEILIGAAAAWESGCASLWNGIQLAVDEVASGGGILGRRLRVLRKDDGKNVTTGIAVAQNLIDQPALIAVLGHWHSILAETTSLIYDRDGVITISFAGRDNLTQRGLKRIFRLGASHGGIAKVIINHLAQKKIEKVAIINYVRDGSDFFANSFEQEASSHHIDVVDRFEFDTKIDPFWLRRSLSCLQRTDPVELLFVTGKMPMIGNLIRGIRELGSSVPIVSGRELSSSEFLEQVGSSARPIMVADLFPPDPVNKKATEFVGKYRRAYGAQPDEAAALGYDSVMVLKKALEDAGTPDPRIVAEKLHALRDWEGVTGTFGFDAEGNSIGREPIFRQLLSSELSAPP